jgi:hypothetical protein
MNPHPPRSSSIAANQPERRRGQDGAPPRLNDLDRVEHRHTITSGGGHRNCPVDKQESIRGSQFRSKKFVRTLKRNDLIGSMGRIGACADNAAMESFFSLLQNNVLDTRRWTTREELRLAIVTWIERTYHRRRRQRTLGKLTPIEYETIITQTADLAA